MDLSTLRILFTNMTGLQIALGRSLGVGPREIAALGLVAYSDPGTGTTDLRRHLGLSAAATTELVDRLVTAGHLVRLRSKTDRRVVLVSLSGPTASMIRDRLTPLLDGLAETAERMPEHDRDVVHTYLSEVIRAYARAGEELTGQTSAPVRRAAGAVA